MLNGLTVVRTATRCKRQEAVNTKVVPLLGMAWSIAGAFHVFQVHVPSSISERGEPSHQDIPQQKRPELPEQPFHRCNLWGYLLHHGRHCGTVEG